MYLLHINSLTFTMQPKPAPVLAAVNKPLTVPGRRVFPKTTTASDTTSNTSSNSSPLSSTINKNRWNTRTQCSAFIRSEETQYFIRVVNFIFVFGNDSATTESSESRAQENNENPVIKNDEGKKVSSHGGKNTPLDSRRASL